MNTHTCPKCGHQTADATVCPGCGQEFKNGRVCDRKKPTPPPEAANWVITPTPPEMIEEMKRSLNEEEILAELEEVRRTGGVELKDFIHEIEAGVSPGE